VIDLIKERFEKAIKYLDEIYGYDISIGQTNEILSEIKVNIEKFAYLETSNLLIFNEILCDFLNIKRNSLYRTIDQEQEGQKSKAIIPQYIFKILYKDLNDIIENNLKNKKFPFFNYKEYYFNSHYAVRLTSLLVHPDIIGEKNFYSDTASDLILPNVVLELEEDIKNLIIQSIEDDIYRIERFINEVLFYNLKLHFDLTDTKSNPGNNPSIINEDFKKEYISSWINETITSDIWKKSMFDLWEIVFEYDLDSDIQERIEKHQEKLFNTFVNQLVYSKLRDISENPLDDIKIIIANELQLFKKFLNGDISELTVSRINQIIKIDQPEKVLLQYDKIIKNDFFDSLESHICIPTKWRTYHPRFLAYFIFRYIKELESELAKHLKTINIKLEQSEIVSINPKGTFKIVGGASKKNKATVLFELLEKEKHIDINSKNDFINAFIGNPPDNKINWIGRFGDLKSFINYSISENLIEDVKTKWVITADIFTHDGIHFINDKIKDTVKTASDEKIKKMVRSII
jgi:hypothetical protein